MKQSTSNTDINKQLRSHSPDDSDEPSPPSQRPSKISSKAIAKKKAPCLWGESLNRPEQSKKNKGDQREEDRNLNNNSTQDSIKNSPFSSSKTNIYSSSGRLAESLGNSAQSKNSTNQSNSDLKVVFESPVLENSESYSQRHDNKHPFAQTGTLGSYERTNPINLAQGLSLNVEKRQGLQPNHSTSTDAKQPESVKVVLPAFEESQSFTKINSSTSFLGSQHNLPHLPLSNEVASAHFRSPIPSWKQNDKQTENSIAFDPFRMRLYKPIDPKHRTQSEEVQQLISYLPTNLLLTDQIQLVKPYLRAEGHSLEKLDRSQTQPDFPYEFSPVRICDLRTIMEKSAPDPFSNFSNSSPEDYWHAIEKLKRKNNLKDQSENHSIHEQENRNFRATTSRIEPIRKKLYIELPQETCVRVNYANMMCTVVRIPTQFILASTAASVFLRQFSTRYLENTLEKDLLLSVNHNKLPGALCFTKELLEPPLHFEVYSRLSRPTSFYSSHSQLQSIPPLPFINVMYKYSEVHSVFGFCVGNGERFVRWEKRVRLERGLDLSDVVMEKNRSVLVLTEAAVKGKLKRFRGDSKGVVIGLWKDLVSFDEINEV